MPIISPDSIGVSPDFLQVSGSAWASDHYTVPNAPCRSIQIDRLVTGASGTLGVRTSTGNDRTRVWIYEQQEMDVQLVAILSGSTQNIDYLTIFY
jgi:hypothetical protein